ERPGTGPLRVRRAADRKAGPEGGRTTDRLVARARSTLGPATGLKDDRLARVPPHEPYAGSARQAHLLADAEAEAGVVVEVALLRGLEVGADPVAIAFLQYRGADRGAEAAPLGGGVGAERRQVPVRWLRRMPPFQSEEGVADQRRPSQQPWVEHRAGEGEVVAGAAPPAARGRPDRGALAAGRHPDLARAHHLPVAGRVEALQHPRPQVLARAAEAGDGVVVEGAGQHPRQDGQV